MNATQRLANYAVNLRYSEIPREAIDRAKACILDILAVSLYGSTKPWSRAVVAFVRASRAKGRSTVFGERWKATAAQATLVAARAPTAPWLTPSSSTTSVNPEPVSTLERLRFCPRWQWRKRQEPMVKRC